MNEIYDFRIKEKFAPLLFAADEGTILSSLVRKVVIKSSDPRFPKIGEFDIQIKRLNNEVFFYSWSCIRSYSSQELANAQLFRLVIKPSSFFEPEGERCGTKYDDSKACPKCGADAAQVSELILDFRKIPKRKDVAATIARNEWIISQNLAEIMVDNKLVGFDLLPARHKADYEDDPFHLRRVPSGRALIEAAERAGCGPASHKFSAWMMGKEQRDLSNRAGQEYIALSQRKEAASAKIWPRWYQVLTTSSAPPMVPPTRFGMGPFDEDIEGRYRCPLGHTAGLNVLSEISVPRAAWDGSDICLTRQYVGNRRGVLRPERLILISPRFRSLLVEHKVQGVGFEAAHFV